LKIRNVGSIEGKIIVEHNPSLEYLELGTDFDNISPTQDAATGLILSNLSALVEISGDDATGTFATVELYDLPALTAISLPSMLPGERLSLRRVQKLTAFDFASSSGPPNAIAADITIEDVGLETVNQFFLHGVNGQNLSVRGIPNVSEIQYRLLDADEIFIGGHANLVVIHHDNEKEKGPWEDASVRSLTLSGIDGFGRDFPVTIDTLTFSEGTFLGFSIYVKDICNLDIHNNQNLSIFNHSPDWTKYSWKSISIKNNPSWHPVPTLDLNRPDIQAFWVWPDNPLETVELVGLFDDSFL
jgi:hypothetical protein